MMNESMEKNVGEGEENGVWIKNGGEFLLVIFVMFMVRIEVWWR